MLGALGERHQAARLSMHIALLCSVCTSYLSGMYTNDNYALRPSIAVCSTVLLSYLVCIKDDKYAHLMYHIYTAYPPCKLCNIQCVSYCLIIADTV